jgi:nucleotide-binding universal stress UspA family protein
MEKILVTTDLSANSKAGIRYAIHLAKLRNAELIILNVYHVLRASAWSDKKYAHYAEQIIENLTNDLASFVKDIYHSSGIQEVSYQCVLQNNNRCS